MVDDSWIENPGGSSISIALRMPPRFGVWPTAGHPAAASVAITASTAHRDLIGSAESHQVECGAADEAVGAGQRLGDLEVVVTLAHDERVEPARAPERVSELARLPLELRRFLITVGDDDRARDASQMALRTVVVLDPIVELHVTRPRRQPRAAEIVHAADADAALHHVARQAELGAPVGDEYGAGQMAARRVPGHVDAAGIAAERRSVLRHPSDGATDLGHHAVEAHLHHGGEIGHDVVSARSHERLGRIRGIPGLPRPPGATVFGAPSRARAPSLLTTYRLRTASMLGAQARWSYARSSASWS